MLFSGEPAPEVSYACGCIRVGMRKQHRIDPCGSVPVQLLTYIRSGVDEYGHSARAEYCSRTQSTALSALSRIPAKRIPMAFSRYRSGRAGP